MWGVERQTTGTYTQFLYMIFISLSVLSYLSVLDPVLLLHPVLLFHLPKSHKDSSPSLFDAVIWSWQTHWQILFSAATCRFFCPVFPLFSRLFFKVQWRGAPTKTPTFFHTIYTYVLYMQPSSHSTSLFDWWLHVKPITLQTCKSASSRFSNSACESWSEWRCVEGYSRFESINWQKWV